MGSIGMAARKSDGQRPLPREGASAACPARICPVGRGTYVTNLAIGGHDAHGEDIVGPESIQAHGVAVTATENSPKRAYAVAVARLNKGPRGGSAGNGLIDTGASSDGSPSSVSIEIDLIQASQDVSLAYRPESDDLVQPPALSFCEAGLAYKFSFFPPRMHTSLPPTPPNHFSTRLDRDTLVHAAQMTLKAIMSTKSMESIVEGESPPAGEGLDGLIPLAADSSLETIEERIRQTGLAHAHPGGTAAMGKVVDREGKVLGVKGLRVTDASIIPIPLSGHPQATLYAMADQLTSMILGDS
ncbi:hypothetical protein PG997_001025 [Apiospora hydei]|uniref:Glucose-methanol-choline oxidoreductase C-terminal domain-containing protein n=1 Tax=Apiospora hydei TaxID=1337664 RepID=A0ABR1XCB3_9PEZI